MGRLRPEIAAEVLLLDRCKVLWVNDRIWQRLHPYLL
jgi:hypothetical protein